MENKGITEIVAGADTLFYLDRLKHKTIMWHLTGLCNQDCAYCYGSFGGSSYKKRSQEMSDVSTNCILSAIGELRTLEFDRIYFCGGEVLLRKDFWEIIGATEKMDMQVYVLSNLSFLPNNFTQEFINHNVDSFSFSLDSIRPEHNDFVRGNTNIVMNNAKHLLDVKFRNKLETEIGMYVVVTKRNIDLIGELIDWGVGLNVNYITLQVAHLPIEHKYHDELSITSSSGDLEKLSIYFEMLKDNDMIRRPSDEFMYMTKRLVENNSEPYKVLNCFSDTLCEYFFIDSVGNIKGCACKQGECLGNIKNDSFLSIANKSPKADMTCEKYSMDCLATFETAYPLASF